MSRSRELLALGIATAFGAAVLMLAAAAPGWLRVAVGLTYVLLLPGWAVMSLVDRGGRLRGIERLVLSVGSSIALTMFAVMALAASVGLTSAGVVAALGAVTLLALLAARMRSRAVPDRPTAPDTHHDVRRFALAAAGLVACCALVLMLSTPRSDDAAGPGVVQLWALPDEAGGVRIGARNIDAEMTVYTLTVEQGGRRITQARLHLPAGAQRLFEVRKSATWTSNAPVTAVLGDPRGIVPSRTVSVWGKE